MSDALGDPLRNAPEHPPFTEPSADEDAVNLLNNSAEPTDDSPTVITKTPQASGPVRAEDHLGGVRGRRLAHFELIEPIGVGGMAAVLRARDTQLDRLVALKILPPEMALDPENIRRFHQEARSAARLDHENIARVFFCGEDQRLHFIAFEFVEGDNLRTILEKRGRLPVGEALHYMLQVAAGLAHAANRGVVHRDIKPSNIIITPNGRAKLVDMGLARSLEPQHDLGLTQSGVTLGTFDYISPEQALEPRDADVRSDIYSLGCTFYHMLTGQPPVPEGTAAKKLHHHQYVKPADPRQFVPDLPDEAAIILDRMMAKQPKDRYQTPEHLVHHLYLAARKLGAAAEVPEGVLAVEAALPSPPAARPLVLAAFAAIAVVGLIFLVDVSPTPPPEAPSPLPSVPHESIAGQGTSPPSPSLAPTPSRQEKSAPLQKLEAKNTPPVFNEPGATVAALEKFLRDNKSAREIILELDDLDLRDRDDNAADLVIANPVLTIRPRSPSHRPTIRDQYRPRLPRTLQTSLTIQSDTCTIENIRFVLDQTGATVPMAILWLHGTRRANLHGCEFIQASPCGEKSRMASVLAESAEPATLTLRQSCFLGFGSLATQANDAKMIFDKAASGGQDAVTRRGPVHIDARDCVFGPHAATFRLELSAPGKDGLLRLNHCSVMTAPQSAVYDLADNADAQIEADFSLFSHPGDSGTMGMAESAVLMRRASSQGQVAYWGRENRYHQLDNLDDLKNGEELRELETSPWKDPQPLEQLKQLAIEPAFAVNPRLPELRVPRQAGDGKLIGAERVLAFSYLDHLPPLDAAPAAPPRPERVVQNRKHPDYDRRLYPTLEHALVEAQSGDIIRLQRDGEVDLDPRKLSGEKLADLTIRADPGFHPILVLREEGQVNTQALFEIYNGKLRLEGLEIRLRPRRDDDDGCAVVSFFGDGECVLKGCLVTLERSSRKAALAVLPERRMKKSAPASQTPRLMLENCVIRGQGDLLWMQGGQAAEVAIDNSLVALSGSLANVESDKKDEPAIPNATLALHLHKVTTYLGENLIRLHAGKTTKGLPRARCEPADCLFLPADDRAALVRLEGPEDEERELREKFTWESNGKNAYGNFTTLLEQKSIGVMMKMPPPSNLETWKKDVSGEMNSEYNVKLPSPPAADAAFTQLLPGTFRPSDGMKDYGADVAVLRSLPALRASTEVPEEYLPAFDRDGD